MFVTTILAVSGAVSFLTIDRIVQRKKLQNRKRWRHQSTGLTLTSSLIMPSYESKNSTHFRPANVKSLFIDPRAEQFKEISVDLDKLPLSEEERKLNQELTISSISLCFSSIGALFFAPISYLSIPGLCWMTVRTFGDVYHSFKKKRSMGMALLCMIFMIGTLATANYFAAALGISFYRLSRKILSKTEDRSRQSLIDVFGNQRRFAWLVQNGTEVRIAVENLNCGDIIVVYASETIPVDGSIVSGTAGIDQRFLTGESRPAEKKIDDAVFASTTVLSGQIYVHVEKAGQETLAAQIGEILNHTADFKTSIQSWGEQISETSAWITLGMSALTFPFLGATTALTILNASFGTYMILLGPLSMLSFLNLASKHGILVKDGRSLQLFTQVDMVVFDKTGTLTLEEPHVGQIYTYLNFSEKDILAIAAAAEYKQTHPIALAILKKAQQNDLHLPEIYHTQYEVGYGLRVNMACPERAKPDKIRGMSCVRVGSRSFMEMENINLSSAILQQDEISHDQGHSVVYVAINNQLAGAIELHTTIRPETRYVIQELRKRNMEMAIISGDNEKPTKRLAQELGIQQYFAETLPEHKAELIGTLQAEGKTICFVGDGINDSIALKQANVSVSLRGASSAATDAAQVVLMHQDLNQLLHLLDIASDFKKNMQVSMVATVIPGFVTLFGALYLGFGITHSVICNAGGAIIGASNSIGPWFKQKKELANSTTLSTSEQP